MTKSKSIVARHLILNLATQAAALAFLGLPALAAYREALALTLGLPPSASWMPAALAVIAVTLYSYQRLNHKLSAPMHDIAEQCKTGQLYPLHRENQSVEEKLVRDFLIQLQVRLRDVVAKLEQSENELLSTRKERDRATTKRDELEDLLAEFSRIRHELSIDNASLRSESESISKALAEERRAKVAVEVEKRAEEIQAQLEHVVSKAALTSLWAPRLLGEIRTPANVIHGLATRMVNDWERSSLDQLRQGAAEILRQCEAQLERLKEVQLPPQNRNGEAAADHHTPAAVSPYQNLISREEFKGFDLAVTFAEGEPATPPDPAAVQFLRAACYYIRTQNDTGRIRIRVKGDDEPGTLFTLRFTIDKLRGKAPPIEALRDLAQKHGVAADSRYDPSGDLQIRFPLRTLAEAPREDLARLR